VIQQVKNISHSHVVQRAWASGRPLVIHGWIYSLRDGLLKDLGTPVQSLSDLDDEYRMVPVQDCQEDSGSLEESPRRQAGLYPDLTRPDRVHAENTEERQSPPPYQNQPPRRTRGWRACPYSRGDPALIQCTSVCTSAIDMLRALSKCLMAGSTCDGG